MLKAESGNLSELRSVASVSRGILVSCQNTRTFTAPVIRDPDKVSSVQMQLSPKLWDMRVWCGWRWAPAAYCSFHVGHLLATADLAVGVHLSVVR
jgi:hypothetical protein